VSWTCNKGDCMEPEESSRVVFELADKVARYRTALVALLAYLRKHRNEYREYGDQQLIMECERLLEADQ